MHFEFLDWRLGTWNIGAGSEVESTRRKKEILRCDLGTLKEKLQTLETSDFKFIAFCRHMCASILERNVF
jgi:hypothetical protein